MNISVQEIKSKWRRIQGKSPAGGVGFVKPDNTAYAVCYPSDKVRVFYDREQKWENDPNPRPFQFLKSTTALDVGVVKEEDKNAKHN